VRTSASAAGQLKHNIEFPEPQSHRQNPRAVRPCLTAPNSRRPPAAFGTFARAAQNLYKSVTMKYPLATLLARHAAFPRPSWKSARFGQSGVVGRCFLPRSQRPFSLFHRWNPFAGCGVCAVHRALDAGRALSLPQTQRSLARRPHRWAFSFARRGARRLSLS
jgi:hypothetical protein